MIICLFIYFFVTRNCDAKMCAHATMFDCMHTQMLPRSVSSATSLTDITRTPIDFYWWRFFKYKNKINQQMHSFVVLSDRTKFRKIKIKENRPFFSACALSFDNNSFLWFCIHTHTRHNNNKAQNIFAHCARRQYESKKIYTILLLASISFVGWR